MVQSSSQLGILGHVLGRGRWEEVGSELGCFAHVASDLHLTLHEGDLWVELAQANCLEVIIRHRESSISFGGLSLFAQSLAILQVNLVDERWLSAFLCCDLEAKNGINFGNEGGAVATSQVSRHHVENILRLET